MIDEEACMGEDGCEHPCRDVCPQVNVGRGTITIQDDGTAYIDPASCGSCQLCISECPPGSIEIV